MLVRCDRCGEVQPNDSWSNSSSAGSLPPDAEKMLVAAQEQPAVGDRGRGDHVLANVVPRQLLKRVAQFDDRDDARLANEIKLAVSRDRRRLLLAAKPLAPDA